MAPAGDAKSGCVCWTGTVLSAVLFDLLLCIGLVGSTWCFEMS